MGLADQYSPHLVLTNEITVAWFCWSTGHFFGTKGVGRVVVQFDLLIQASYALFDIVRPKMEQLLATSSYAASLV